MIRLTFLRDVVDVLEQHFAARAPREEGAFCLLRAGRGIRGLRLLVKDVILPQPGAWEIQTVGQLRPSARWISATISQAIQADAGLLFIHSHPDPRFPVGLSPSDRSAFISLARTIAPMLPGPFAAIVAHEHGWTGFLWDGTETIPVDRINGVGRTLRFLSAVPLADDTPVDLRQRDALGVIQDRLRHLTVGVVGCGGLGSPAAEQLMRMGIEEIVPLDNDSLDTPSNVRRVFGSKLQDLQRRTMPTKVQVVQRHLKSIGLDTSVRPIKGDVRTERVFRELLDCDVVLCGTDTHGSRAIVNDLASAYLLPVIDVGVRVGSKANNHLSGLLAEVRILTPTTPCLWCRRAISGDVIRAENLPQAERERLQREGYVVQGVGEPAPSIVTLTVLGSSLTTSALIGILAEEGEVAPHGYWVDGLLGDSQETGPSNPIADCWCRSRLGLGDAAPPPFIKPFSRERRRRDSELLETPASYG